MNYAIYDRKKNLIAKRTIPYLLEVGDVLGIVDDVGLVEIKDIVYPLYRHGKCSTDEISLYCDIISPPEDNKLPE
jgi:hypothetical protein